MDGIIHLQPAGGAGSGQQTPIEVSIASGGTEIVDTYDASTCPFVTWKVSLTDMVSLVTTTRYMTIDALHDFSGSADFNCHGILGVDFDIDISVTAGVPVTDLVLTITNNGPVALDVCAVRVV